MAMRAQISLMFDDEDLFDNFVTPYKENRLLNSLIIKCLSAYYYNEEVRNMIEGTSIEEATNGETVSTTQSICDNIRATLVMQDYLASELQNAINNGTEDIQDVLHHTNTFAEQSGVAKSTTSQTGTGTMQLNVNNLNSQPTSASQDSTPKVDTNNSEMSLLIKAIMMLAEDSGNSRVANLFKASQESTASAQPIVTTETVSQTVKTEVSSTQENLGQDLNSFEIEEDFISAKDDFAPDDTSDTDSEDSTETEEPEPIIEDASDAISELLGSL